MFAVEVFDCFAGNITGNCIFVPIFLVFEGIGTNFSVINCCGVTIYSGFKFFVKMLRTIIIVSFARFRLQDAMAWILFSIELVKQTRGMVAFSVSPVDFGMRGVNCCLLSDRSNVMLYSFSGNTLTFLSKRLIRIPPPQRSGRLCRNCCPFLTSQSVDECAIPAFLSNLPVSFLFVMLNSYQTGITLDDETVSGRKILVFLTHGTVVFSVGQLTLKHVSFALI